MPLSLFVSLSSGSQRRRRGGIVRTYVCVKLLIIIIIVGVSCFIVKKPAPLAVKMNEHLLNC